MYPTRLAIFVALAGAPLSVLAAILVPPYWMIGGAWVLFTLALIGLDSLLAAGPGAADISLRVPSTMGVGRADLVFISLFFNKRPPGRVELAIESNDRFAVEPRRQSCAIADKRGSAEFSLTPRRRGEGRIDAAWIRWPGPLGLCWRQRVEALNRVVPIVPNFAAIKEDAVQLFQRDRGSLGQRAQRRLGEGTEFSALKDFQTGMDRRSIDWKQSARHRRLIAREFQAEENLHIIFAIDAGRLMCAPIAGLPRLDRAIQALLLLSYVALRLGDRVGLFAFNERPVLSSGTVTGIKAFPVLGRAAAKLDYSTADTNFTLGLTTLAAEVERRSIIVVFTDFSDSASAELMLDNIRSLLARHVIFFVAFQDAELEDMIGHEPEEPADVSRAVLAEAMLREREAVTLRLRRMGVIVIDAPLDRIGMRLIEAYWAVKSSHSGL